MSGESRVVPDQSIAEQRCGHCGRPDSWGVGDTYWFADNDLWNEVNGSPAGFMCPKCFTELAQAKGIAIGWRAGRVGEIEEDHNAYINCLDGGWLGYQAVCETCGWRGVEYLRDDHADAKDRARADIAKHSEGALDEENADER